MDELRFLLTTTPKDGYKIPESCDVHIVRCYNVPAHFIPNVLETYICDFFLKNYRGTSISFKQIIRPSTVDCIKDHCWKIICGNAETAKCLLQQKNIVISAGAIDVSHGKELKSCRIYFYEGHRLDFPYPVPIPPLSSPSLPTLHRSNSLQQNFSLSNLEENSVSWLGNSSSGCSKGILSGTAATQAELSISAQQQPRMGENWFSQQQLSHLTQWPSDMQWRDVPDYIKRKFCIVIRNKPPEWEQQKLEQFLNIQFSSDKEDTPVKFIYMTKTFPKLATIACKNEVVRNRFIAMKSFKLPSKWATLNVNRGMSDRIQIEPYMPPGFSVQKNCISSDGCMTDNYASGGSIQGNFGCSGGDSAPAAVALCNSAYSSSASYLAGVNYSNSSKTSFYVLEARNKPNDWNEKDLTNLIESHYKMLRNKLVHSADNDCISEQAIAYCWPCAGYPVGTFVCQSEAVQKLLLTDQYVKLPYPHNEKNKIKGLPEHIELHSWRNNSICNTVST